jgi:ribonucleoside-diphosphate reductase alpha chain
MKSYIGEQTVPDRVQDIADHSQKLLTQMFYKKNPNGTPLPEEIKTFSEKFFQGMSKGWGSLASPVWSNFGRQGLPVSCNNVTVADDMESILFKLGEVGYQTKGGAGTSVYLGDLRGRGSDISGGGLSDGVVNFFELFQTATTIISQGPVRRGAIAGYLPVTHPDIKEWLTIRKEESKIHDAFSGVCIPDSWMKDLLKGDKEKAAIWMSILQQRDETGQPYIWFSDNANNAAPSVYKKNGRTINGSNLCNEIALSSSVDESYVCVLSSLNLYHYDEWSTTNFPQLMLMMLDAVTEEYIQKTKGKLFLASARNFALRQRAIGVGTLGLHSAYQKNGWPFASEEARNFNEETHKTINEETLKASKQMAVWFGEPSLLEGTGLRNTTRMAIAPTKSSSFILGAVSEGIQPIFANAHTKDLAKGKFSYYNPELKILLKELKQDTEEVWDNIEQNAGSVQQLAFLSKLQKDVFKTFAEINQLEIVHQAATRQHYIDQGQSLNLCIPVNASPKDVSKLLVLGWELGIKGFYYQLAPQNAAQIVMQSGCEACEA